MRRIISLLTVVILLFFQAVENQAQTLQLVQPLLSKIDSTENDTTYLHRVDVFLDGSIKSSIANKDSGPTTGALGIRYNSSESRSVWTAMINVAASEDTLTSDFGTSILVPNIGTGSFQSGMIHHLWKSKGRVLPRLWPTTHSGQGTSQGIHVYMSGSRLRWSASNKLANEAEKEKITIDSLRTRADFKQSTIDLGVLSAGIGLNFDIIRNSYQEDVNNFAMRVQFGFTSRILVGDGASNSSKNFKKFTLGTKDNFFFGFETGFLLRFNNVVGEFNLYAFPFEDEIPGLSGIQMTIGLSLNVDIFKQNLRTR